MKSRIVLLAAALTVCAGYAMSANDDRQQSGNPQLAAEPGVVQLAQADKKKKADRPPRVTMATCVLFPVGESGVKGVIHFHQDGESVKVTGEVTGLAPGKHGFHVHEHGDLSDLAKADSCGGHFNPTGKMHGKPEDEERHVGDLGNIEADADGKATIDITDSVVRLNGRTSIIGRSIIVHVGEDKFTQPTGDAGARAAAGVIGISKPHEHK